MTYMKIRIPEYKWQIFFVTGMANISTGIAISSISLALPVIAEEFSVSMAAVSWLSLVYTIIPSCTLLIFGRIADIYGYKRQFIGGFTVFGVSSLILPLAANGLAGLILFRCFQGIGYAMMISITQALINRTFPANERGKALGINVLFASVGLAIGPTISGLLMSLFSWRSVFYFNVPTCIIGVVMSVLILKKNERDADTPRRMDWLGAFFFALFIGLLMFAINFSSEWGVLSVRLWICVAVSLCALILFIYRAGHTETPLMKLALFRNPVFSFASIACVCSYILHQMSTFLVPFFLMNILLIGKSDSGFIMLASPVAMMLLSPVGGRLVDRYGSRIPAITGLSIIALGCFVMCSMTDTTPAYIVILSLLLYGTGHGLSVTAINSSIFSAVPREDSGIASGMTSTMRNLGQSMGVAFSGAIMTMRQNHYFSLSGEWGGGVSAQNMVYLKAQRDTYIFGLFVVILAINCIIRIPSKKGDASKKGEYL